MVTKWRVDGDKMRTTQEEMATNSSDFSSLPPVYVVLSKKTFFVVSFPIFIVMSQNFHSKVFIFVVVTTKNVGTFSFFLS